MNLLGDDLMSTTAGDPTPPAQTQHPVSSVWLLWACIIIGSCCWILAIALGWLAQTPLEHLREYGRFVRNSQDVTVERYTRFQHICWFSSASLVTLGAALLLGRKGILEFARHAWHPQVERLSAPACVHDFGHVRVWLALILGVGAALRLSLFAIPMAYDESYSWLNFASHPLMQALGDLNSTNNHLLNTLCMFITGRVFGPEEWALRIGTMSFGLALLPASFVWARQWQGSATALLTTALIAISAPLITYSADARGYSYVLCCAVVLDYAMARLASCRTGGERSWILAGTAIVVGTWSMIIMGYAIVASLLWYVFSDPGAAALQEHETSPSTVSTAGRVGSFPTKLRRLVVLGWLSMMLASLIYMPGYICRGTLFLHDPVMRQSSSESSSFIGETGQGLTRAAALAMEGAIPSVLLGGSVLLGLWFWPRDRHSLMRLLSPFVVVVGLNFVRHVNPPPRVYLWLLPWVCLLAAYGLVSVARWLKSTRQVTAGLILAILVIGVWYGVAYRPVLLRSEDRMGYASVPNVVRRLQQEVGSVPAEGQRLIAPLPCDLPAIFYMEREGFRVPINGLPQPGEHVWLIAQEAETPADVLKDGLVQLQGWEDRFTTWRVVERFKTLTLYTAELLPAPAVAP